MAAFTLLPPGLPSPSGSTHLPLTAPSIPHIKQLHAHLLRSGRPDVLLSRLLSLPRPSPAALDHALATLLAAAPAPDPRLCGRALRALAAADPRRSLLAYARARRAGLAPDRFALPALLSAAARCEEGETVGREAHGLAKKLGLDKDAFVQTALVRAYGARGRGDDARRVFDRMAQRDVVAWSVMLDCYCQSGHYCEALQLFQEMKSYGIAPDQVILATVLSACGRTANLVSGKAVHSYIVESNVTIDTHLQGALVSMYSNCGSMDTAKKLYDEMSPKNLVASTAMVFGYAKIGKVEIARSIFDEMFDKDLVSWSAMISGYSVSSHPGEALKLFHKMQALGVQPDEITMLSVISACSHLGALDQARWIHMYIDKNAFHNVLSINNALIDMYSKCGSLASARKVFDEMPRRNVITWTSMITGLAMHGDGRSALLLFDQMKSEGVVPNAVTFVGLLYACSHSGLVEEGRCIFQSMAEEYKIEAKLEHYGCMVDLLGRAKLLHEALELIESMPFCPNVVVWGSLLGACRIHGDVELGAMAANKLLELDPDHDGAHVLLSNVYAKAGRWEDVREVRKLMKCRGISKEKGCSWIELDGHVHEFMMGDESHPESSEIHKKLNEVVRKLELAGYAPYTGSVLVDLDVEEKRRALLLHSEKLALSFGLINLGKASCIRIAKNLRVCEDCHSFMKLVSKVFDREIVLRDRTRFHHYKNGLCSCKDFW